MPLMQAAIDELKAIYKKHCGEELSDVDAWDMANSLLRLYSVLYGLPKPPYQYKDSNFQLPLPVQGGA